MTDIDKTLAKVEAIKEVVRAAYWACEDSEDAGGDSINIPRNHFDKLSSTLDSIDEMMPDEVIPALPPALVTLVSDAIRELQGENARLREALGNLVGAIGEGQYIDSISSDYYADA